ncbi:50S ribosomal protein L7 [Oscillospiraceae bacterium MB08-C2-2]|nr:50S ribosomal protein L7 [Oscillospiraceae bacterium MB08-C2-2]
MENNLLLALGLCRKAGKLVMGFDPVVEAMVSGKVKLLITTADLSPKSLKNITYEAQKYGIAPRAASLTMEETKAMLGRRTGILAVLDPGLAGMVEKKLSCENEED